MSMLTSNDYKKILEYYNIKIPSKKQLKSKAEDILSLKLCRCIKKVAPSLSPKSEKKAIGICTKTIFNRKKLERGSFKCVKTKRNVEIKKKTVKKKTLKRKQ